MKSGLEWALYGIGTTASTSSGHYRGRKKSPIMFDAGFVNFLLPFVCLWARKKHKRIFGPNQFVNYSLAGIRS
jgi:hypothetical protein